MLISAITHPQYSVKFDEWCKWRDTYEGGQSFINKYLQKLSTREDKTDFDCRLGVTYCPAFAKTGINEIRDSIYQRMSDITRDGGSASYNDAIQGLNGGVDLEGSSMDYFMGCKILSELLTMSKVGIYVDMPPLKGRSLADNVGLRPYLYFYKVEDLKSWVIDESATVNQYQAILLEEYIEKIDEETGFPIDTVKRYRHVYKDDSGIVWVKFYNDAGDLIEEPIRLGIKNVPFIPLEISESLLKDVANYQVALLNLASTDMIYALKSNFPFYTEQYDPKTKSPHLRNPENPDDGSTKEVEVGTSRGRQYPTGVERPDFIHPSSEPLTASMAKQEQLKEEIRLLLKLTIANLKGPKMASAESKKQDTQSLETGLSYVGLELETAERRIAEIWAEYEGLKASATVFYPESYSLRTEEDRQAEADKLKELLPKIPSLTGQKAIVKRIVRLTLGPKVSRETMNKIEKEIDAAVIINNDYLTIQIDSELGLVSNETASKARLYPAGEVEKAKADHAERLARIAVAQMPTGAPAARGLATMDANPSSAKDEKAKSIDTTKDGNVVDKTRGAGK